MRPRHLLAPILLLAACAACGQPKQNVPLSTQHRQLQAGDRWEYRFKGVMREADGETTKLTGHVDCEIVNAPMDGQPALCEVTVFHLKPVGGDKDEAFELRVDTFIQQDAATGNVYEIAVRDDPEKPDTIRKVVGKRLYKPGRWSESLQTKEKVTYSEGPGEECSMQVNGTEKVETAVAHFDTWRFADSAVCTDGSSMTSEVWYCPALGCEVKGSFKQIMADKSTLEGTLLLTKTTVKL